MRTLLILSVLFSAGAVSACELCHGDKMLHERLMQLMAQRQQAAGPSGDSKSTGAPKAGGGLDDSFWEKKAPEPADDGRSPGGRYISP